MCILLCRRLLKKLGGWINGIYINTDKKTAQAVLNGRYTSSFYIWVPGRCRRPLPGVTAARLSGRTVLTRRPEPLAPSTVTLRPFGQF